MGKYLPIIVTADCGSLTRAGKILGYAQPNMGSIVTRFEKELGVKLFHRNQQGVTLTEIGEKLVAIMRQIEDMEDHLQEVVARTREACFRVGVFQNVANQWMPQIVTEFCRIYPDTVVQLEHLNGDMEGEAGIREKRLDCAFFRGSNFPDGMQHVPLVTESFYLLVPDSGPLAEAQSISLTEVAGKYPYVRSDEVFDWEGACKDIRRKLMERDIIKVCSLEDSTVITLVSQGLGISVIPELSLCSILPTHHVKAIPLQDIPARTISLLLPKKAEQSSLTLSFLHLLQKEVAQWEGTQTQELP